jgi:hypothetical protein
VVVVHILFLSRGFKLSLLPEGQRGPNEPLSCIP